MAHGRFYRAVVCACSRLGLARALTALRVGWGFGDLAVLVLFMGVAAHGTSPTRVYETEHSEAPSGTNNESYPL